MNAFPGDGPEHVVQVDEGFVTGELGNIAVTIWRESVTRPRVDAQAVALSSVASRSPGACGYLCIIEPSCSPPDAEMRRALAAMLREQGPRLSVLAGVVEGDGFRAAATRTVLSALGLLAGSPHVKNNFYASVAQATPCFVRSGHFGALTGFCASIERLRARMPPSARSPLG